MTKTYKTQGTIATIKWCKKGSAGAGKSANDALFLTLEPVSPYLFEEKDGDSTKKYILLNGADLKKEEATKTDFIVDFNEPMMSFATLLLLKQNRTKVEIETSSKSSPFLLTRMEIK